MQELTDFANALADEAAIIIAQYFRQPVAIDHKTKNDPVTVADRAVEQKLRQMIEARYPDDGILGEEFGIKDTRNGRVWVLDPIDGTKSFIIGRPSFGTLISLWDGDTPLLGVIDQPITKERWIGIKGQATTFNGQVVHVRSCPDLRNARVGSTTPRYMTPSLIVELNEKVDFIAWGGDCYLYGLLAGGNLDIVIEQHLEPFDYAALVPVVHGAGGEMCDWNGRPLTLQSNGQVAAFGDSSLKEEILSMLKNI
ncbi:MAG: inositol monophosphatase family protein [Pseudobdellovibrionaceae bacterium]|nr:inositol monophosphatase family protein [Pseudobdellovibrionaceae bacterium]